MNPLLKRRAGPGYNRWKAQVKIRDNHACRICGCRGQVEADHIRQWAKHPEMAFNPANGITLCTACHTSINGREKEFEKFFDFLVERSAKPQSTPRKASRTLAFSHATYYRPDGTSKIVEFQRKAASNRAFPAR